MEAQIRVGSLQASDPTFEPGSLHSATALLTNPTASPFTYVLELYLGVLKAATSGLISVAIPAGGSINQNFPIVMPLVAGDYAVYLDVTVEGVLIAHYQATVDVTIEATPDIDIGDIVWT